MSPTPIELDTARMPLLDEAVRMIVAAVAGEVNRAALHRALETEMAKGPRTLVALVKVSRRRAIDRVARTLLGWT